MLGPFQLLEPIGTVYKARHVGLGSEVAIKMVSSTSANLEVFRAEARAICALDHPHIIGVYDYGEVGRDAQAPLIPGAPWLAMELASGGTLLSRRFGMAWSDVLRLLLNLLDALAHAHAWGVLHRDLKPANILYCSGVDARPGWKLADFGLAHAINEESRSGPRLMAGTLGYMAPEQINGQDERLGPWTDLYALGCVAYEMVARRPVFRRGDSIATRRAHLDLPPPPLPPGLAVPAGFQAWLMACLEKRPGDRFRRAADAAWALSRLRTPTGGGGLPIVELAESDSETFVLDLGVATRAWATQTGPTERRLVISEKTYVDGPDTAQAAAQPEPSPDHTRDRMHAIPPPSDNWRRSVAAEQALRTTGLGLGILSMRAPPFVGREDERDRIWAGLVKARQTGSPVFVGVCGAPGVGASRLIHCVGGRADETGAATVLRARYGGGSGGDGPAAMLRRFLRTGTDPEAAVRRVLGRTGLRDPDEISAITSAIQTDGTSRQVGGALIDALEWLSLERPVMVLLDDLHREPKALAFVKQILALARGPILVLGTWTAGAFHSRSAPKPPEKALAPGGLSVGRELNALPTGAKAEGGGRFIGRSNGLDTDLDVIELGPLSDGDQVWLVRQLLGVSDALAADVARHTAGNPGFAVDLVRDWVRRGRLVPGRDGFELAEDTGLVLPVEAADLRSEGLDRFLRTSDRTAMELAAILGEGSARTVWLAACDAAQVQPSADLEERLIRAGLARSGASGWSFSTPVLRELVVTAAREAGRWETLNQVAAEVVDDSEKKGRHLYAAGDLDGAVDALMRGLDGLMWTSRFGAGSALISVAEKALDALGSDRNERWAELQLRRVWVTLALNGDTVAAEALAAEVVRESEVRGWLSVRASAGRWLARCKYHNGRFEESKEILWDSIERFRALGDASSVARCLRILGQEATTAGDLATAERRIAEAEQIYRDLEDRAGVVRCRARLGNIARQNGDWDVAAKHYHGCEAIYRELGNFPGMVDNLTSLAEVARWKGDLDDAEALTRKAIRLDRVLGKPPSAVKQMNLAILQLLRQDWIGAERTAAAALRHWDAVSHPHYGAASRCLMLAPCAVAGDWLSYDKHQAAIVDALVGQPFADVDFAWAWELAGEKAMEAGRQGRAVFAWKQALDQWQKLGREDRIRELERRL